MRRKIMQFASLLLSFLLLLPSVAHASSGGVEGLQVGLYYGANTLTSANLEVNTGFGSGYRFGYFDSNLFFVELGYSSANLTSVSMARTSNLYLYYSASNGAYVYSMTEPSVNYQTVGCFHIVLPQSFSSFESARQAADNVSGGFVAWISGEYQVRTGAYTTSAAAQQAMAQLGLVGSVAGTSVYAVNVLARDSAQIIFQFDGGANRALGVMPDVTGAREVRTWFKGYRYHGGFRYQRLDGGDLTVVNILPDFETYVKGVVPYEMNNSWHKEALKAQAVAARTYGRNRQGESKHKIQGFDVCNSDCCQVYRGIGANSSSYQANEVTDQAVDETAGLYLWYDGVRAETYYSSSHGGASEDIYNVWGSSRSKYPYLCGVIDPYEQLVADINSNYSSWTRTFTKAQVNTMFSGYSSKVNALETVYSPTGNVIRLIVRFENNQSVTLGPTEIRALKYFGLPSIHFTINNTTAPESTGSTSTASVGVNVDQRITDLSGLHVISGSGTTTDTGNDTLYAITGSGSIRQVELEEGNELPPDTTPNVSVVHTGDTFVFRGAGWGHSLGLSQYGALAMAKVEGLSFDKILTFYYPGTYVSARG